LSARASGSRCGGALRDLELWCVDLAAAAPALREMERRSPRLSDWDRQTAAAMADREGAAQWLAAHAALRLLLERAAGARWRGVTFARGPNVRPHLPGAAVQFSLAHIDGLALIGLAPEGDIGVDLERERAVRVRAPRREAIEAAGAALEVGRPLPEDGNARFLQAWVRLEAFAKAQGCGIGRLLAQLGIVGARAVAPEVMRERVAAARAEARAAAVHDLDLGSPLFAAVALAPELTVPPVRCLPARLDGLHELLT
jgi:4'-phosphopantetheinyl transferase